MPLTFTPDESEARRRKMYGDLAASGDKAMGYGFDALSKMESMAKEKAVLARQADLDADTRSKTASDLTLRQAQEAREGARDQRDATRDAFDLDQAEGKAVRDAEDRTLTLQDGAAARVAMQKKAAREQIEAIVRTARDDGLDDRAMIERASATPGLEEAGINWQEVQSERRAQEEQDRKERLAAEKTQSEITENLRPRGAPKGPRTPEEIARQAVKDEAAKVALDNAKAKGKGGITTATKTDVEKKTLDVRKVRNASKLLRAALSDPATKDYTGPLSGLQNHIASKFGVQSPEAARISSLIGQYFDAYKVATTGAAATDKEMVTLMTRMPNIDDQIAPALAKLGAGDAYADETLAMYQQVLASGQVFDEPTQAPEASSDKISVKRKSDGKTGEMPAASFNPDLYERVQ